MSGLEAVRDALAATARVRERDQLVVIRALLDAARTLVPDVDRVWLFAGPDPFARGASVGADGAAIPFAAAAGGPWIRAARERQAFSVGVGTAGVPAMIGMRGIVYVPLVAGDRAVAVAAFGRAGAAWTEQETVLLEIASAPVAYLLVSPDETQAVGEGATSGVSDDLTGLYNAAFLERRLPALVSQSEALGRPLTVVAIQLDGLAALSEAFGKAAAEPALRAFGAVLRSKLRGDDLAVHRGSEGFVLLLPETDAIGALRTVERLRAAARAEASGGEPLGFSAGIATWRPGRDAAALLSAAAAQLAAARGLGVGEVHAEIPA